MSTFVLVASPLVGPAVWQWLAAALAERGERVVVPELAGGEPGRPAWRGHVDRLTAQLPDGEVVLVAHSAAGRLVPLVAESRPADTTCVFVDAQLPVDVLPPSADDWFVDFVGSIAVDGVLPPWSRWWGEDAWHSLVPDPDRRAILERALPRVPLAAATEVPPAPRRPLVHASYLRLSSVYEAETRVAGALGWPVARIDGGHLHLAVAEDEVAAAILDLVAQRSP